MLKLAQNKRVKISGDIELKDRLVGVQRVVKVTKGGRAFGFSAIVVVGDEQSIVGIGLGKSKDVATAIQKAIESAKKNLVKVPILKGTIPHEQASKFSGSQVLIKPASHGTGVKAGGAMRAVLEAAGVKDVLAKSKGSSNPHNLVKATLKALLEFGYDFIGPVKGEMACGEYGEGKMSEPKEILNELKNYFENLKISNKRYNLL